MQPKIRNEARWRALILFGLNVATYKFAFAQALLDVAKSGQSTVSLDQLSLPYARHLIRHLSHTDKQGTSSSSRFLEACRQHRDGHLNEATLKDITLELGFNNVVDAFQNVSGAMGQTPFYTKDFKRGQKNLVLTDALLGLGESKELGNLRMLRGSGRRRKGRGGTCASSSAGRGGHAPTRRRARTAPPAPSASLG